MAITNENQIINVNEITRICNEIDEIADSFVSCAEIVGEAGTTCSDKALSVEGKTLQPALIDFANQIIDVKNEFSRFMDSIRSAAVQQYNYEVTELNEYEAEQRAAAQQRAARQ